MTPIGVLGLGRIAMRVSLITNLALRAARTIAELGAGIIWLLGTALRWPHDLAVVIFSEPDQSN